MNTTKTDSIAENVAEIHAQLQHEIAARKALQNEFTRVQLEVAGLDGRTVGNNLLVKMIGALIVAGMIVVAMVGVIATLLMA